MERASNMLLYISSISSSLVLFIASSLLLVLSHYTRSMLDVDALARSQASHFSLCSLTVSARLSRLPCCLFNKARFRSHSCGPRSFTAVTSLHFDSLRFDHDHTTIEGRRSLSFLRCKIQNSYSQQTVNVLLSQPSITRTLLSISHIFVR